MSIRKTNNAESPNSLGKRERASKQEIESFEEALKRAREDIKKIAIETDTAGQQLENRSYFENSEE